MQAGELRTKSVEHDHANIRRRTRVVTIFPIEASLIWLASALAMERNEGMDGAALLRHARGAACGDRTQAERLSVSGLEEKLQEIVFDSEENAESDAE